MVKGTNDPLAGKSQALKAALAAVERMNGAAARWAPKVNDLAAKNTAKPLRPARPTPGASYVESYKSGEA